MFERERGICVCMCGMDCRLDCSMDKSIRIDL